MRTKVWMGFGAAVVAAAISVPNAGAQPRVMVSARATCTMTFQQGVRYSGNVSTLTPLCRARALAHNAKIAEAEDKANDDDDDDDDKKVQAIAQNIESQKAAADAAYKAAWQYVVDARQAVAKATNAESKKAAEQELRESQDDYNKKLDEAAAVAKKISDKAQRSIRASLQKEQDEVRKVQDKLKTATGLDKAKLEKDLIEEQEDVAEKEELLAKSDLVEALQQFRIQARKIGAITTAAEARLDQAKDAYEKVENRVKSTLTNLKSRADQLTSQLKQANAKLTSSVRTVKTTANTVKNKFKDLKKDVKSAAAKAKSTVNDVKKTVNDVKGAIDDLFDW